MTSLDAILSPENLAIFRRILEVRRTDGTVAVNAEDAASAILRMLVTEHGRLDDEIAVKLADLPPFPLGRADIVPMIVAALAGDDPAVEAWIEAIGARTFDLFKPVTYGDDTSKKGSPGVYLQRMLANYRNAVNNPRVSRERLQVQRTELAILCAIVLVKQLQKAICSKLALGPSYAVMTAVHRLPDAVQRRIDALTGDEDYRRDLQDAIADVTARHAHKALPERTNAEVRTTVPTGVDVETYFSDRGAARTMAASATLVEAIERRGDPTADQDAAPEWLDDAMERVTAAARKGEFQLDIKAQADAATAYLRSDVAITEADLATHHDRLRAMMPGLSRPQDMGQQAGRLFAAAHFPRFMEKSNAFQLFASRELNAVFAGIVARIDDYACRVGPPPPGMPIEHGPLFEQAVGIIRSSEDPWPARERWQAAGLLVSQPVSDDPDLDALAAVAIRGLQAFDIAEFRARHG